MQEAGNFKTYYWLAVVNKEKGPLDKKKMVSVHKMTWLVTGQKIDSTERETALFSHTMSI